MSLIVSSKGSDTNIDPVPEGLHPAVCVGLYDIGVIYDERWEKTHRKLVIQWELPTLPTIKIEDKNLPRCLTKLLTMSLHEKAVLRQLLESWRGRRFTEQELAGFDLEKILGVPCQVQVMHDNKRERVFAGVVNVLPAINGGKQLKATTPLVSFSVADLKEPTMPEFIPEWIAKMIVESKEWEKLELKAKGQAPAEPAVPEPPPADDPASDDVPF